MRNMTRLAIALTLALGTPLALQAEKIPAAPAQRPTAAPDVDTPSVAPAEHSIAAATCTAKLAQTSTCDTCALSSDCPQRNVCQVECVWDDIFEQNCCECIW